MKPVLLALAAAAATLSLPAVAATPAGPAFAGSPGAQLPASACIRPADIVNHRLGKDGHSLYLLVNGRGTYRLEMKGACLQGAVQTDPVTFREAPGFSRACKPSDLLVTVVKGGPRPCFVQSVALLSPGEARALPKDLRP